MNEEDRKDLVARGDDALHAGLAARREGRLDDAHASYHDAHRLYREAEAEDRVVLVLVNRGALEQHEGSHEAAERSLLEARQLSEDLGDVRRLAVCEGNLAALYLEVGSDDAEPLLRSALKRYEELGDPVGMGNQLGNLGMLYQRHGEYEKAVETLDAAAQAFMAAENAAGAAATLRVMGDIFRRTGDAETASEAFERALFLSREVGDQHGEAYARRAIGQIHLAAGDVDLATGHFRQALTLHEQAGDARGISAAHLDLGQALVSHGDVASGLEHLREALAIARTRKLSGEPLGTALVAYASQLSQSGDMAHADRLLAEAAEVFRAFGDPQGACAAQLNQATIALSRGDWNRTSDLLDHCEGVAGSAGLAPMLASIVAMRGQVAQMAGLLAESEQAFDQAVERFQRCGRDRLAATARISRAIVRMELRQLDGLGPELEALRRMAREHHNRGGEAAALQGQAELARVEKRYDEAFARYDEAIAIIEKQDHPSALSALLLDRAEARLRSERWDAATASCTDLAAQDLEQASVLAGELAHQPRQAMCGVWQAEVHRRRGALDEASSVVLDARGRAGRLGYPMCLALADQIEARIAANKGEATQRRSKARAALERFEKLGARVHLDELCEDFPDADEPEESPA